MVEDKPVKKDRKDVSGKDVEEIMEEDDRDSKVMASIARQEVQYEGAKVSRERRIQMLEQEIDVLSKSRKTE